MTTIAYRDDTLAADSQDTYDDIKTMSSQKLFKIERDDEIEIVATAGHGITGMLFIDWYSGDEDEGREACEPKLQLNDTNLIDWDDNFHILVLNSEGLFEVDRYFKLLEITEPFFAIGSGAAVAMGAMHMGATAKEAVEVAKKVDLYTGGKVRTMSLP